MSESGKRKRGKKRSSLTTSDLVGLASAKGTVTPAGPGMVTNAPAVSSPASVDATPKRLAYTSGYSLITLPSMDAQTSDTPVLQSLADIVTVLRGFLV